MWAELKTLFWLQWKLTLSMFRSRRTRDTLRIVLLLLQGLKLVMTFPMFALMGIGLAVVLILVSSSAAYELAMATNAFLFFVWLVLPASYNSQMVERFEMSRLFPHPIRFRSIVVGSTLMSMLTMTGLWTVPLLLGEVIGLAWHQPLALPLIVAGALPTFALLVLTGRIMDDLFDLVAGDRRLRAFALALLTVPFTLCWVGQYIVQQATDNYERMPEFLQVPGLEELAGLEEPESFRQVLQVSSRAIEILRPSRILVWTPPGWVTSGMALSVRGDWGRALAFLAGSAALVGGLLWLHAGVTRKLMEGAALGIGAERVKSRRLRLRVSGPPTFWALFHKDWSHLWRNPMPRRLLLSSVMMAAAVSFPLRGFASSDLAPEIRRAGPMLAFAFAVTMIGMAINIAMTANYFGTFDREGFATLALAPVDRRHTLLSANLAILIYAEAQYLVLAAVVAVLTRSWAVVPLGAFLGLCLQAGSIPVCGLVSILAPYRTQLKHTARRSRQGNIWGMLAWVVSAPPALAMVMLPYVFWRPGLILTLPLAAVYSGTLYVLTLKPLARLLQRREHSILEAVTAQE
jgi:hypothetical protein